MPRFSAKFQRHSPLILEIRDDSLGRRLVDLLCDHLSRSLPTYRDRLRYTARYMHELAVRAKETFGWHWDVPEYSAHCCVLLHKDLERLLGHDGFHNTAGDHDHLLTELHYGLHVQQYPSVNGLRDSGLQIEWFSDQGFGLPDDFEFVTSRALGTIELLNPWVGHAPMQIYNEQDSVDIAMTCRFHDFVKPGLRIATSAAQVDRARVLAFLHKHGPDFVRQHGAEKIWYNTGFPVIGQVVNLDTLLTIINDPDILELEDFRAL